MACLSPADSIHATSLFGIGVRVGYYLQWYTLILEERYLDQEFPATKVSLLLFMVANALTVLIKIKELDPVVIYVTLLLTFGYWYNILPLIAWFFIALMSKKLRLNWNASIFPRSREPNPELEGLWTFFLLGILSYTIYFWIQTVPELQDPNKWCDNTVRYGFFFDKFSLQSEPFRILNIVLAAILLGALAILCFFGPSIDTTQYNGSIQRARNYYKQPDAKVVVTSKNIRAILQTVVCNVIIIATELCVKWNKFNIQELVEAGQLFSVLFAAVILARVLYFMFKDEVDQVLKSMPRIL